MGSKEIPNIDIVDPIGEIRGRARELWRAAGSPTDRDWTHFFSLAEQELTAGKAFGEATSRGRKQAPLVTIPPEIEKLRTHPDTVISALATTLHSFFEEHEALCLGFVLQNHSVTLADGTTLGPWTVDAAARIVANFANDYDQLFLEKNGYHDLNTIPFDQKSTYWQAKLEQAQEKDAPLTYSDRNTISRIHDALLTDPRIKKVTYRGGSFELA